MADGTISMAEGLGGKALYSNEMRRKQKNISELQSQVLHSENPKSETSLQLGTPHSSSIRSSPSNSTHKPFDPCPGDPTLRNSKNSTASDLGIPHQFLNCESHPGFTAHVPVPSSSLNGLETQTPKSANRTSPARKLQHAFFEESLKVDAEERGTLVQASTNESNSLLSEVHILNPKIMFNARGDPYVEGDPNLGYSPRSSKPRYASTHLSSDFTFNPAVDAKAGLPMQENLATIPQPQPHQSHGKPQQNQVVNNNTHTYQPNYKPKVGQTQPKPKPKNWASLLQSQSPSMDMKLDHFADLQRGKEALGEIDLELTDVGKWNKYLVGHFLDGQMAYPLIVSTARNQWKEHFVAVKPDVAGFYLFEFKDEQSKMQVLEGGPYFFSQKYLVLKDWHRMMKPAREQPTKIPAWVKLHDLPLELWNQECLSRVASTIGRPLHVDQATAKTARQPCLLQTKSTKARICIEVSAEQVLPDEVKVVVEGDSVVIRVEYQVLPPMCNICHVFGHHTSKCARETSTSTPPLQPATQVWTRVGNGKQKVGSEQSIPGQLDCFLTIPTTVTPQQTSTRIETLVPEEELSDSEEELIKVLEEVVSSNQGAEQAASLEISSSNLLVATGLHDSKVEKVISVDNQSNSAPTPLSKSAAKRAAQKATKLKRRSLLIL